MELYGEPFNSKEREREMKHKKEQENKPLTYTQITA